MKKILVTIVLIAAIIGLANTMALAQSKVPQMVTGTITYNGVPVSGATVRLYKSNWCFICNSFPSTYDGKYEIRTGQPAGTYRLKVNVAPNKWASVTFYYPGNMTSVVNLPLSTGMEPPVYACPD